MPDIYSLGEIDAVDYVTAIAINRGYPAYIGKAIGLLSQFTTVAAAAAWLGYTFQDTLVNIMDTLHDSFGPDAEFMQELKYAENPAFDLPDDAVYVEFDRFASCGRMTLLVLVGFIVKLGGGQLIMALGAGWLKNMMINSKLKSISEKLDETQAMIELSDSSHDLGVDRDWETYKN